MDKRDDWDGHWSDLDLASQHNPAQAFRRELMLHWIKQQSPNNKTHLLDIGSGQGDFIASLTSLLPSTKLAGVEMSATGISQSRVKAPQASFFQRDLSLSPKPDDDLWEWATLAVCSEVLEHVDEPAKVLANAARYLAPGARLFITVPGGPISSFDLHIGHRQHFTKVLLHRLISEAGLIPERISGVGFPFFNLYRMVVILRGKALIKDACSGKDKQLGGLARMVMNVFSLILKRRFNSTMWGWQMTAQARKPE